MNGEETSATSGGGGRRFHLLELVGRGAFGDVYLAEQDSGAGFRRKVALKVLNEDSNRMRDAGRRMRDEARILGRLAHRHIVAVLDLVQLEERWAILMDYVPGADLEHVIEALERKGERFPGPAALEAGAAVLDALDAAASADDGQGKPLGVIHRDIKPSNVRLTTDGEVKVLDFGVARFSLDTREAATRATGWIGTERYMAPERILCEGDTAAGDVYAAAATVLELLLGRPLGRTPVLDDRHRAFVEEALALARERLVDRTVPPSQAMPGDEAAVAAVLETLRRGLVANPADRPNARQLSDELEGLARRLPGESLRAFARRFVPRVDEVLGRAPTPASGTLAEYTGVSGASSTVVPPELSAEGAAARERMTPVSVDRSGVTPRSAAGVAIALVGLGMVLFAGAVALLGVVVWQVWPTSPPEEVAVAAPPPDPEPEQIVDPEPTAPEPLPPPAPAALEVAAPEPAPQPTTAGSRPRPAPAPAPVAPAPRGPVIDRANVTLRDASAITVICGEVRATGTASVRITSFPGGPCRIEATLLGKQYAADLVIDAVRGFQCRVDQGTLTCS